MRGIIKLVTCLLCIMSSRVLFIHGLNTRIFKGSDAPERKFKYHAHITARRGSDTYCGGSIVNKRWILTAAHCFFQENIRKILVRVGSTSREGLGGEIYGIEKQIVHEAFNEETFVNDVALLRVNRDIEFNDKIQPIKLANSDTTIICGESVVFTGFGRIEDYALPKNLKFIALKAYDYKRCQLAESRVSKMQICTLPVNGAGPCKGDSGGALVSKKNIQIGISSHSYSKGKNLCGRIPEIFTEVSHYRSWIDEKIRQH